MKEDNRSIGSTQQFSKINIDSLLHCPHDLTKQSEFRDDLPVLFRQKSTITDNLINKHSNKLNGGLERHKSKYSVFITPENSDDVSSYSVL